jgi:hypothetical protein
MNATPVAQAGTQAENLTVEQWIERVRSSLELLRVDSTIKELRDTRVPNERLISWYEGRRQLLATELGL